MPGANNYSGPTELLYRVQHGSRAAVFTAPGQGSHIHPDGGSPVAADATWRSDAAAMLWWFPLDLADRYGGLVVSGGHDGPPWLLLPGERAEEIAAELRARGCSVRSATQPEPATARSR
ncbi:MAG: hypothetical protein FGM52_13195 [Mycobacterium sp.]|nr:hypothetical protein [Mycobacterium sp.]